MRKALKVVVFDGVEYHLVAVSCGKPTCTKCPHGPYWYRIVPTRFGTVRKYVGKVLPASVVSAVAP